MAKLKERIEGFFGEAIALIFGWLVCTGFLAGGFSLGRWASPLLWDGNPDIFGLLSTIAVLWIYEHRHFEERLDRLREVVTQRNPN